MPDIDLIARRLATIEKERLAARLALVETELIRLNDVVSSLQRRLAPTPDGSTRAAERRQRPRAPVNRLRVQLNQNDQQPAAFDGDIVDYSTAGIGMIVDRFLDVDTVLTLKPSSTAGRPTAAVLDQEPALKARVCNQRQENHGWRVGCELIGRLSREDLQKFGLS